MAVGDRFVRRHDAARSTTSNTTAADISFDTAVIDDGGYSWSSPEVTVTDAGRYLCVFDLGQCDLASSRACGTLVPSINTSDQTRFRATHRYLRNSGGDEGACIGMAILDLAASDDVKIRNPGILTPTDALGSYATRVDYGGGIQLIRLPDTDWTHVERTTDAAECGISDINTTRPWVVGSGTWTKITYNSEINDDAGLYPGSGGDITLAADTKYMIVYGATIYSADASRHAYVAALNIDGNRVQTCSSYQRNTASQGPPICGMYLHETGVSAETLYLEATQEIEGGDAGTPQVADAYLQVIELPSSAEWIHVDNSTTDSLTTALASTGAWYDTPLGSTFRADGDSNLSLDSVNDAVQNDSGAALPVLAIGWHRWDRDSGASGTRKMPWSRWDNGGTTEGYGIAGAFSRGQQSTDDTWQAHYCAVATMDLANGADLSFQVNEPASGANSDMGIYASTSRYFLGVQVLNLETLVDAGTDHTALPDTGTLVLAGYVPTLSATDHKVVGPDVGTLALAGLLPTIDVTTGADHTALPDVGALALTGHAPSRGTGLQLVGYAPTIVVQSAGTDHTALPGAGSLALTGEIPSAEIDHYRQVPNGSVTIAGLAPTIQVTNHIVVEVPTGSLAIAGLAPTIQVTVSVAPDVGVLVLAGLVPTIVWTDHHIRAPPAGALALSGHAPIAAAGDNRVVQPNAGSLALTGYAPSVAVTEHRVASPDSGALALAGYTPTLDYSWTVHPDTGSLALAGYSPTIIAGDSKVAQPAVGTLALTTYAPSVTVSDHLSVSPPAGSLSLTGYLSYSFGGPGLRLIGYEPTVVIAETVTTVEPGAGALALNGLVPTIVNTTPTEVIVLPGTGSLLLEAHAPALEIGIVGAESSLYLTGYAPTVVVSGGHVVSPGAGSLSLTGYAPSLTGEGAVAPDAGSLTLSGYAPELAFDWNVSVNIGALQLSGLVPTVSVSAHIETPIPSGALQITGYAPTVTSDEGLSIPNAVLSLTGYAPTVITTIDVPVLPGIGTLSLAGQIPTVARTTDFYVYPPAGVLTLTGWAFDTEDSSHGTIRRVVELTALFDISVELSALYDVGTVLTATFDPSAELNARFDTGESVGATFDTGVELRGEGDEI